MATELLDNETSQGTVTFLTADCNIGDGVIHVNAPASTALQAPGGQFRVIMINPNTGDEEIALVTANAWSANWTVTRAVDSSSQHFFPQGSVVKHILTRDSIAAIVSQLVGATPSTKAMYLDVTSSPYNCKGDGASVSDGAMSSVTNTTTLTTAAAASMVVGQKVYVRGAGAAGVTLQTTVATKVDSTHVTLAAPAVTTVAAAQVVYGTDNHDGLIAALATNRTLFFPNATGFYLVDAANNNSKQVLPPNAYTKMVGESRDGVVIRLGPEGVTAQDHVLFGMGNGQTIFLSDMTLQGQDFLGNGGPPTDPGTPTGKTRNYGISHGGNSGLVRLINVHLKHFVSCCGINATSTSAGIDADFTHFEGYGSTYKTICIGAVESAPIAWTATKRVRAHHCRFSDFGDSAGANFYHAVYVGTDFALDIGGGSYFHRASPTSTGAVLQHYDANVSLANAAPISRIIDTDFGPDLANMSGVTTSYNSETSILGCTFEFLEGISVNISGPAIIEDCTFIAPSDLGAPNIQTIAQGQSTGLTWSAQIMNCRFRGSVTTNGMNCIKINATSATSDFKIKSCDFDGCTSASAIYILIFGSSGVVGGTIDVSDCRFAGNPGSCFYASSSSTAMNATVQGNHFYTLGGTKLIKNDTTALNWLAVHDNDFSNASAADVFVLTTTPTNLQIQDNFGTIGYRTTNGGVSTSTPGAVTTVNIAHGLGNTSRAITPTKFVVQAGDANARGAPTYYVTVGTTNITLNFAAALTAATAYTWNWRAEI